MTNEQQWLAVIVPALAVLVAAGVPLCNEYTKRRDRKHEIRKALHAETLKAASDLMNSGTDLVTSTDEIVKAITEIGQKFPHDAEVTKDSISLLHVMKRTINDLQQSIEESTANKKAYAKELEREKAAYEAILKNQELQMDFFRKDLAFRRAELVDEIMKDGTRSKDTAELMADAIFAKRRVEALKDQPKIAPEDESKDNIISSTKPAQEEEKHSEQVDELKGCMATIDESFTNYDEAHKSFQRCLSVHSHLFPLEIINNGMALINASLRAVVSADNQKEKSDYHRVMMEFSREINRYIKSA